MYITYSSRTVYTTVISILKMIVEDIDDPVTNLFNYLGSK